MEKLKARGQALLQRHGEREGRDLQDVLRILRDVECHWFSVLQSADEEHRYYIHEQVLFTCPYRVIVYVFVFKYMVIFMKIHQHTSV